MLFCPVNLQTAHYQGWNLIAEADPDKTFVRTYLWGLDLSGTFTGAGGTGGLLAVTIARGPAAGTHLITNDGQGNVTGLVSATTGQPTAAYTYDPFGQLLSATGPAAAANPIRFSTRYEDPETSLLYYGYRFLHPASGRWLNRDPLGEAGGVNLYGFVGNNPANAIDRVGLDSFWENTQEVVDGLAEGGSPNLSKTYNFGRHLANFIAFGGLSRAAPAEEAYQRGEITGTQFAGKVFINGATSAVIAYVSIQTAGAGGAFLQGAGLTGRLAVIGTAGTVGAITGGVGAVIEVGSSRAIYAGTGQPYPNSLGQDAKAVILSTGAGALLGVVVSGSVIVVGEIKAGNIKWFGCAEKTTPTPQKLNQTVPETAPSASGGSRKNFEAYIGEGGEGILASIDEFGTVDFVFKKGPNTPSGTQMFNEMIDHFGSNVKAVRGNWNGGGELSTNFDVYKAGIAQGLSPEAAAAITPTGKMAIRAGFGKIKVINDSNKGVLIEFER